MARKPRDGRLVFCDLSMFYCERGGGIRTYHRAKMEWFAQQSQHHYVLVAPGPSSKVVNVSDTVTRVDVFGITAGYGADGYRVPLNLRKMLNALERFQPDVVEVSDPWISGPLSLAARRLGRFSGILTSFFHTDSLGAYVVPWLRRRLLLPALRRAAERQATRLFWRMQARYDRTLASSLDTVRQLRACGLDRVLYAPFGLEADLLHVPPRPATTGRPVRLLYAGRLQPEKGIDLVLDTLSEFVDPPAVTLTVAGSGPYAERVVSLNRPGVSFAGYVGDRTAMCRLYRSHDVLLSPSPTETFGLTTLEAMACGLAIVGVDAGGIGDLMRQAESPFTFASGDRTGFVRAVREAIMSDRREAARQARAVAVRHGTWSEAIQRQTAMYCHLVRERGRPNTRLTHTRQPCNVRTAPSL
jgi:alpha-1,6-mannosyltransferase